MTAAHGKGIVRRSDARSPSPGAARPRDAGEAGRKSDGVHRADASRHDSAGVLSKGHEALCHVKVGDTMPEIELAQLGGERRSCRTCSARRPRSWCFGMGIGGWREQQLADLGPDVVEPFGRAGVAVVGIAVDESRKPTPRRHARSSGANFANLLDADGKAFAQVGSEKLPRTFLLDPQGKILWFDIEYSLGTRRELHQALRAVAAVDGR